jgi:predicted DsbA family dithiol-disulfide isomerase
MVRIGGCRKTSSFLIILDEGDGMKIWYTEIRLNDLLAEKIRIWEKETGKEMEELIEKILKDYFKGEKEKK